MNKRIRRFTSAIALFLLVGFGVSTMYRVAMAEDANKKTIHAGVYLDGVYVGGLTKEEAMEEYDKYIDGIEDLDVTFTTVQGSYSTSLKDIGVSVSVEDAVDTAYNYGRQGNILSRYKEIKALEEENVVLIPTKEFDVEALKEKLANETADIVKGPKNASITRSEGEFVVHPGETGVTIKVDDTVALLQDVFESEWEQKDITLKAVVEEQEPEFTEDDFYAIDSVLGQAVTSYGQWNTARSQNLSTGASKISGTVLMPGEQFSVYDTVAPFTEENGYANAGQYVSNGEELELVDGLGGGICQVSTTLYNAVLKAELQVDERYPHSLTVSYVKLGMDAAIAGDYMDFKFTNSTEYPIYIEGYAGGGNISFAVYGHETRPENRTISFESKIIETYEPGEPEEIKDPELEKGEEETEQEAHTGYYVELWKHIYVDGVEVDCVKIDGSKYNAQAAKIRIGTKKVKDKDKNKDKDNQDGETGEGGETGDTPTDTPSSSEDTGSETPTEAPTDTSTEAPAGLPIETPTGSRKEKSEGE
ncbi:MAG: VanW family protein [Lachnospiraceae bacterium]|nr:VanW family protein [Lachnospiraceae bacterium]